MAKRLRWVWRFYGANALPAGDPVPFLRRLGVSAAQSLFFNHWLEKRMQDGLFERVLLGDVMTKLPFGGLFVVEDLAS